MTKEIGWFDVNEPMQQGSQVAEAKVTMQKVGGVLSSFAMGIASDVIRLLKRWQLVFVSLAFAPFIAFLVLRFALK
ncbi:ATP-binding cassette (ABC) Superfamily [Phytophthora palmivora]|uniref:ATP-binding cassette (ABC) Superfamily n=1 Tax=Phytophthora palmivora TaxID=4796 RepID=A0A2P4XG12_9STRA|nr:ATP-binding cassette (ABC) Superfamily [Phytophthora palmivora]